MSADRNMINFFSFVTAKPWRANLCAMALGAMLTLAFAPFQVFPLAILSLAGLLTLWLNTDRWRAFRLGWWFGIGLFTTGTYWTYISIHDIGDVPVAFSVIISGALIAFMATYPAFVGYCLNRFYPTNTDIKLRFVFPAIWTLSEWLRSNVLSGFPWLLVGYSQTVSPLKAWAPIFSVYGVTFVVALISGTLVNAFFKYRRSEYFQLYVNLMFIAAIWVASAYFAHRTYTQPEGQPIKVSLVQGNIPQTLKWSPEHVSLSLDTYAELTEPLWGKSKLIIWPEAAVPLSLQNAQNFIQMLDEKAKKSGANLYLGIPIQASDGEGYYNAIATLGDKHQAYFKRRLVPFGEFIPVPGIFSQFFDFLHVPLASMMSGKGQQDPFTLGKVEILPSICYEIAYAELMFTRNKNIGVLLTVTNDAWFGKSIAQAQHLQMGVMRALELQRPLLFASNDGITAIIDPDGTVQKAAPTHQAYVLQGQVQPMVGLTPWMMTGLDPLTMYMLFLLFLARRAEKKANKQQPPIQTTEKGLPQT